LSIRGRGHRSLEDLVLRKCGAADLSATSWLVCTSPAVWTTAPRLLLFCLQPAGNLANDGADRPVGGAGVLHCRGRRAAVAASVGVTPGVPQHKCSAAPSGLMHCLRERSSPPARSRHCRTSSEPVLRSRSGAAFTSPLSSLARGTEKSKRLRLAHCGSHSERGVSWPRACRPTQHFRRLVRSRSRVRDDVTKVCLP
jgi:hypothetical protein